MTLLMFVFVCQSFPKIIIPIPVLSRIAAPLEVNPWNLSRYHSNCFVCCVSPLELVGNLYPLRHLSNNPRRKRRCYIYVVDGGTTPQALIASVTNLSGPASVAVGVLSMEIASVIL